MVMHLPITDSMAIVPAEDGRSHLPQKGSTEPWGWGDLPFGCGVLACMHSGAMRPYFRSKSHHETFVSHASSKVRALFLVALRRRPRLPVGEDPPTVVRRRSGRVIFYCLVS